MCCVMPVPGHDVFICGSKFMCILYSQWLLDLGLFFLHKSQSLLLRFKIFCQLAVKEICTKYSNSGVRINVLA